MRKEARQGRIACRIVNEGWRSSRVRTRTIKQLHAITQAQHPAKGSLWAGGRVEGGSTPKQAPIGGVGGGGSSTDLCYKCNQTGHWARNCPNAAGGGGGGGGYNSGGFGGGGGKKGGCFKCGLDGHWASNCPNVGGGGGGGYGGRYGGGSSGGYRR